MRWQVRNEGDRVGIELQQIGRSNAERDPRFVATHHTEANREAVTGFKVDTACFEEAGVGISIKQAINVKAFCQSRKRIKIQ